MKFRPVYLWCLLPAVMIIGWAVIFYGPVSSGTGVAEKQLASVMAEKSTVETEMKKLAQLRQREDETRTRMDSMSADIPRYNDLPAFMKEIARIAGKRGVYLVDLGTVFSTVEDQRPRLLANPLFEITVKGRYLEIGHFLEELGGSRAFSTIQKAGLTYEDARYPILTGYFLIQFKARRG
jgi:Tfp pilus assembly protein PilO